MASDFNSSATIFWKEVRPSCSSTLELNKPECIILAIVEETEVGSSEERSEESKEESEPTEERMSTRLVISSSG